jgi:hypothetical protein
MGKEALISLLCLLVREDQVLQIKGFFKLQSTDVEDKNLWKE